MPPSFADIPPNLGDGEIPDKRFQSGLRLGSSDFRHIVVDVLFFLITNC